MGLWPVLIQLLQDQDHQVRTGVAWICGTALQNNPDAQKAFLDHQGLPNLITMLQASEPQERAKAQYAISGLLKHCAVAVDQFKQADGFQVMATMLKTHTEDATTLRKVIFLYNTLMVENATLATELIKDGLVALLHTTIAHYTKDHADEDMVEKALRTLLTAKQQQPDLVTLDTPVIQRAHDTFGADHLNLDKAEWATLLE
ncbi:armadillo-type protein [Absidia repens]|uniref:Armadillo-type protein n=1 Tax=Absidia repens TaxID=90262 RepID=A0A1X2HZX4_9FUNG|nr:armadillo-type protein [Absidia repens]